MRKKGPKQSPGPFRILKQGNDTYVYRRDILSSGRLVVSRAGRLAMMGLLIPATRTKPGGVYH